MLVRSRTAAPRASAYALILVLGMVSILPIWIPTYPPMCDAPQIAAQVELLHQLQNPNWAYSPLFTIHSRIPNLAGYTFLILATPLIGAVAACKLAASVALVLLLLTTGLLIEEFDGDPRSSLLIIPGMFGFSFQWGYLSFLLAAPLGVCWLIFAIRYFRRPSVLRATGLSGFFALLFFCHALIAGFAATVALAYSFVNLGSLKQATARWLPVAVPLLMAAAWWLSSVAGNTQTGRPMQWNITWERVPDLFQNVGGFPEAWQSAPVVLAVAVPTLLLVGVRRQWSSYVLLSVCLVIAFAVPHSLFGVDALYQRFALFLLPGFALLLKPSTEIPRERMRMAVAWLVLFALIWSGGMAWRMRVFEREARGFRTLLEKMEPGQRVLSMSFERHSRVFQGSVLLHHAAWYSALKAGVVDPSFACGNVDLVVYRGEATPKVRFADFEFHPDGFDWRRHEGWRYRYFVVHTSREVGDRALHEKGFPVALIARDGDWALYENQSERVDDFANRKPAKPAPQSSM